MREKPGYKKQYIWNCILLIFLLSTKIFNRSLNSSIFTAIFASQRNIYLLKLCLILWYLEILLDMNKTGNHVLLQHFSGIFIELVNFGNIKWLSIVIVKFFYCPWNVDTSLFTKITNYVLKYLVPEINIKFCNFYRCD